MKILIDMSLTPAWVEYLATHGFEAVHWSAVGDPKATDRFILDHARVQGHVVFTHDLDFGNILAVTDARGPSVIQVRTDDPVPAAIGELLTSALRNYASELQRGALLTLEPQRSRARILPLLPGIKT